MKIAGAPRVSHRGVRSSQATPAAVENSAPLATRPQSTYKLGNVVQTSGATSDRAEGAEDSGQPAQHGSAHEANHQASKFTASDPADFGRGIARQGENGARSTQQYLAGLGQFH
jgi:hypothetical protein